MAELKTKVHDGSVEDFINEKAHSDQQKLDSFELIKFFQKITGEKPKMWGTSIVGFGKYHYKSERSAQEGDWPRVGFSPRKAAISLYVYSDYGNQVELVEKLGKFTMGKWCIYVKKLSDIDMEILEKITLLTLESLEKKYGKQEK